MLAKLYFCHQQQANDFAFELIPNKKKAEGFQVIHNIGCLDELAVYSVRVVPPTLFVQKQRLGRRFDTDCIIICQDNHASVTHLQGAIEWHSFGKVQATTFQHTTTLLKSHKKNFANMFSSFFW